MNAEEVKAKAQLMVTAHRKTQDSNIDRDEYPHNRRFWYHLCDMDGELVAQAYLDAIEILEKIADVTPDSADPLRAGKMARDFLDGRVTTIKDGKG